MIVRCDAVENMFLEIHNWCKWLDCNMGKWARIVSFYIFLTCARLNNLLANNVIGLILQTEMCMCK